VVDNSAKIAARTLAAVLKQLATVNPGDLVMVEWLDASRGKIETITGGFEGGIPGALVDCPVFSYGVYLGLFGARSKHIVLLASLWHHTGEIGQVDTTIIPLGITEKVAVISRGVMEVENVHLSQAAFIQGRSHHYLRRFQIKGRKFQELKRSARALS